MRDLPARRCPQRRRPPRRRSVTPPLAAMWLRTATPPIDDTHDDHLSAWSPAASRGGIDVEPLELSECAQTTRFAGSPGCRTSGPSAPQPPGARRPPGPPAGPCGPRTRGRPRRRCVGDAGSHQRAASRTPSAVSSVVGSLPRQVPACGPTERPNRARRAIGPPTTRQARRARDPMWATIRADGPTRNDPGSGPGHAPPGWRRPGVERVEHGHVQAGAAAGASGAALNDAVEGGLGTEGRPQQVVRPSRNSNSGRTPSRSPITGRHRTRPAHQAFQVGDACREADPPCHPLGGGPTSSWSAPSAAAAAARTTRPWAPAAVPVSSTQRQPGATPCPGGRCRSPAWPPARSWVEDLCRPPGERDDRPGPAGVGDHRGELARRRRGADRLVEAADQLVEADLAVAVAGRLHHPARRNDPDVVAGDEVGGEARPRCR